MTTTPPIEKLLGAKDLKREQITARAAEIAQIISTDSKTIADFDRDPIGNALDTIDKAQRRYTSYLAIKATFDAIPIENRLKASDDDFYILNKSAFESGISDWLASKEKPRAEFRKLVGAEIAKLQARKFQESLSPQDECDLDYTIEKLNDDAAVRDSFLITAKNKLEWITLEPTFENFNSALIDVRDVDFVTAPRLV